MKQQSVCALASSNQPKTFRSTFIPDQSRKNPLHSERNNSTYLGGHDEPLGSVQKWFEKMETSIHHFQEMYCTKQPR